MTVNSNLDRFRKDLARLSAQGTFLFYAIQRDCLGSEAFDREFRKSFGENAEATLKKIPNFKNDYQSWYSEAKSVVKQILPDRLDAFVLLNEKPKARKGINYETYVVADYLQGVLVTYGSQVRVDGSAAVPQFHQALNILQACEKRFNTSP